MINSIFFKIHNKDKLKVLALALKKSMTKVLEALIDEKYSQIAQKH